MATYQPTTTAYVMPGLPPNYQRPKIRFDCSFLGTKIGVLKLLELIITAIAMCLYVFNAEMFFRKYPKSDLDIKAPMLFGYLFYRMLPFVVGPSVNILLWSYLFHIVERYDKIPWYIIDYVVCTGCCIYSIICAFLSNRVYNALYEIYEIRETAFVEAATLSVVAAAVFFYNIIVVYQRKSKNIPPQVSE